MDFTEVMGSEDEPKEELPVKVIQFPVEARLKAASWELEQYRPQVHQMVAQANALEVKDDEGAKASVVLASSAKKLAKALDAKLKEIIDEPDRFVKAVKGIVKQFTEPLSQVESRCKKKNADFQWTKEVERREKEKLAEEGRRRAQEDLNRLAAAKGVEAPVIPELVIRPQTQPIRTDTGASAHTRTEWKAEIDMPDEVPREFCSPDMRKINEAVRMGFREIKGVRIFEHVSTVIRG